MSNFEYMTETVTPGTDGTIPYLSDGGLDDRLNELAVDGWRLSEALTTSSLGTTSGLVLILERECPAES